MITAEYERLGSRLDDLTARIVHVEPGEHKLLRFGDRLFKTGHKLIDQYVATEVDPLIPPVDAPGYYEVETTWRFILQLIALGTVRGRRLISTSCSLGGAMRRARFQDGTVNRFLADYPTFYDETLTNLVRRLTTTHPPTWFDLTPIAYGLLYPTATDIDEIRDMISRDFWVPRKAQRNPNTPEQVAKAFEAAR